MGRDKLPLTVDGAPLIRRVHDVLASRCDEVLQVGGTTRYLGVRFVSDLRPGAEGPLAGIEAGLAAARHESVFVAAGDLPFLPGDLVEHLLARLLEPNVLAVVPRYGGVHPLCAAYDRELLSAVGAALDDGVRSVRGFLEGLQTVRYVGEADLRRFGEPDVFLMNVNSPVDLERARAANEQP